MKKFLFALLTLLAFCQVATAATKNKETYVFEKDIQYKTGDSYIAERCLLDVAYVQESGDPRPVVVWFHGGGLTKGSKNFPNGILNKGVVAVSVEYRFYPNAQVAEILDDCAAAVAWTFQNISKYGGDPSKIFLSGMSAGGYISAMLGMAEKYLGAYGLRPGNLAGIAPVSGQMITHFTHRKSQGLTYNQPRIDEMAPVFHVMTKDIPPVLLITGDRTMDMVGRFEENDYLAAMLVRNKHNDVEIREYQGYRHENILVEACMPIIHKWIQKHITEKK